MKKPQGRPRKEMPLNPVEIMFRPSCFTVEDWHRWRGQARMQHTPKPHSPCEDCTPEYQAKMIAATRWDHPHVVFSVDSHGFVCGSNPHKTPAPVTPASVTPAHAGAHPTTGDAVDAVEATLIEWLDRAHETASNSVTAMASAWLIVMAANECQACHYSDGDENNQALFIAAKIAGLDRQALRTEMEATLRAELTAAEATKPLLPLNPAAQANGVRGSLNETKQAKNPAKRKPLKGAKPPATPKLSADEAMQGIADALQGNEGGADPGPLEPNPGADAPGEGVGPAARPDGAPRLKVGDRARLNSDSSVFHGKTCTIAVLHTNKKATVTVDGLACEYTFELGELERLEGPTA